MCGLVSLYAYHRSAPSVEQRELLAIRETMRSRGPDGSGLWLSSDGRAGLGHRRLAIIDLDPRANQPMVSQCGRFRIVYNGEFYNHCELRDDLLKRGVRFRTTSDTEVLLELFALDGVAALSRVRGMYAFALWDHRAGQLWLVRDPFGIKPLYYADDGWTVRAASQVKALLAGGGIAEDPDPAGVAGFHLFGSVPEPFTLYQDIRAVPAGHVVKVDAAGAHTPQPFQTLEGLLRDANSAANPAAYSTVFVESVRHHLESDVPVGLFLSAGIDSAAILAAIAAIDPARAETTTAITVTFPEFRDAAADEAPLAAEIAGRFGARHIVREVTEREFVADLPKIIAAMDQPSIDGVNTWFVAKAAAEAGLKVVLSGLGGDELLGGYPSFQDVPRWHRLARVPGHIPGVALLARALIQAAAPGLVQRLPKLPGALEHARTLAGAWMLRRGLFLPHELPTLLGPDMACEGLRRLVFETKTRALLDRGPGTEASRVSLLEASLYMRNQLLRDTDWAAMAHSLEVRVPFIDCPLWEAVHPLNTARSGKADFARALGLPESLVGRPKTGFTTPVGTWIARTSQANPGIPWARHWARQLDGMFLRTGRTGQCSGSVAPTSAPTIS